MSYHQLLSLPHMCMDVIKFLFYSVQYKEYEQVVVEDRIDKEKTRRKQEQEAIELKASIKVRFVLYLSIQNQLFLLRFYGPPVNIINVTLSISVNLLTWAGLDRLSNLPVLSAHTFASNWQLPFFNQRNKEKKLFYD